MGQASPSGLDSAARGDEDSEREVTPAAHATHVTTRAFAEGSAQLAWICEPDGSCTHLNQRWLEYTGVAPPSQLGAGWFAQLHTQDRPHALAAWKHAVANGTEFRAELRLRRHDGEYHWFDCQSVPLRDAAGRVVKWFGTNTDLTERGRRSGTFHVVAPSPAMSAAARTLLALEEPAPSAIIEHTRHEADEHFRRLCECMQEGFFLAELVFDQAGQPVDWRYLDWNSAHLRMSGRRREQLVGRTVRQLVPELEDFWFDAHVRAALSGEPVAVEGLLQATGRYYESHCYSPRRGQFACIFSDITARKQTEQRFAAQASQLRLLANVSKLLAETTHPVEDTPGTDSDADHLLNTLACELARHFCDGCAVWLLSDDEQRLLPVSVQSARPDIEAALCADTSACHVTDLLPQACVFRSGESQLIAAAGTLARGGANACSTVMVPLRARGHRVGVLALHRFPILGERAAFDADDLALTVDIADRTALALSHLRLFDRVRRSERRFARAFETNPAAVAIVRQLDGVFLDVNRAFCALTGFTRDEALGHAPSELALIDTAGFAEIERHVRAEGSVRGHELTMRHRDSGLRQVLVSVDAFEWNREPCMIATAVDVTERRQLESQLRQTQKLESIGKLAGGVAHDFNNLLTVIVGAVELLDRRVPPLSEASELVCEIRDATAQATSLTRQLLAFSRLQTAPPSVVDLNGVVSSTGKMLRRVLGEDVCVTTLSVEPCHVRVDPTQCVQLLLNLAVNARDAMPAGGRLGIEMQPAADGGWVTLTVRDTGVGMTADVQARLFEPFFTTKQPHHGTGLGLAVVDGIVSQAGGRIRVESTLGEGTTFTIELPAFSGQQTGTTLPPTAALGSGVGTILLAEDDASVRHNALRLLRGNGYQVLCASDGAEALRLLETHAGKIDLVVTDVIMPGLSGPALAKLVRRHSPSTKLLYTSGHDDDAVARAGILDAPAPLISKPYSSLELLQRVRDVLHEKTG